MKYVRFEGRCYENIRQPDKDGRVILVDLRDHSRGILADPKYIRECTPEEVEAIEYFLELAAKGRRDESQAQKV